MNLTSIAAITLISSLGSVPSNAAAQQSTSNGAFRLVPAKIEMGFRMTCLMSAQTKGDVTSCPPLSQSLAEGFHLLGIVQLAGQPFHYVLERDGANKESVDYVLCAVDGHPCIAKAANDGFVLQASVSSRTNMFLPFVLWSRHSDAASVRYQVLRLENGKKRDDEIVQAAKNGFSYITFDGFANQLLLIRPVGSTTSQVEYRIVIAEPPSIDKELNQLAASGFVVSNTLPGEGRAAHVLMSRNTEAGGPHFEYRTVADLEALVAAGKLGFKYVTQVTVDPWVKGWRGFILGDVRVTALILARDTDSHQVYGYGVVDNRDDKPGTKMLSLLEQGFSLASHITAPILVDRSGKSGWVNVLIKPDERR
jgi:hypothetical protein